MKTRADELKDLFVKYHTTHPEVWVLFKRLAKEAMMTGIKHYSAYAIVHQIRWHYNIERTDINFKIADKNVPFYARMLIAVSPEYEGFFRINKLRSQDIKAWGDDKDGSIICDKPPENEDELLEELLILGSDTYNHEQPLDDEVMKKIETPYIDDEGTTVCDLDLVKFNSPKRENTFFAEISMVDEQWVANTGKVQLIMDKHWGCLINRKVVSKDDQDYERVYNRIKG
jgi:hypothetical protein